MQALSYRQPSYTYSSEETGCTSGESSMVEMSCNNTLSWDGVLCHLCRHLFDTTVVRWKHDQGSNICRPEMPNDFSIPLIAKEAWWHNPKSLRSCALLSCKLCELVLYSIRDDQLDQWESWQATLTVDIRPDDGNSYSFLVLKPTTNPRPEETLCNAEPGSYWRTIIMSVLIENIPGECMQ